MDCTGYLNNYNPSGANLIVNSNSSTRSLGGSTVPGAGTLQFDANGVTYQLSAFSMYAPAGMAEHTSVVSVTAIH